MSEHLFLTGGRLVTAERDVQDCWVEVSDGWVSASGSGTPPVLGDAAYVDVRGMLVLPGLVDAHQHGGGGTSYDGTLPDIADVVLFHQARGTTTSMASLVSTSIDKLVEQLARLAPLVQDGRLAGVHLEGPWLNPRRAGAHELGTLQNPTRGDVGRLIDAGQDVLRMVTIAPELPGGLVAVGELAEAGIVVALGHTDATYEVTREALRRGARVGTHLFNAMRPVHHREPGPVVALVESDAAVELIADGLHLHPAVLAATARAVGPGRMMLVSDATAGAGMPDAQYHLGGQPMTVRDGVARRADGSLAGSTSTLVDAIRFAVTVAGLPLQTVVAAVTAVPATVLGLADVGDLRPGARADITLMTSDLLLAGVLSRGRWVRPLPDRALQ